MDEDLLREESGYLLRLARALTGHRQDAEDLVQGTYLRAAGRLSDLEGTRLGYLRQILVNLHRDQWRRKKLIAFVPPVHPNSEPTLDPYPGVDLRLELDQALAAMDLLTRQIIVLHYLADLRLEDVAALVDRPPGTVRRLCAAGVRALAIQLPAVPLPAATTGTGAATHEHP